MLWEGILWPGHGQLELEPGSNGGSKEEEVAAASPRASTQLPGCLAAASRWQARG